MGIDFDQLLDKHQHIPEVREAIAKIMGAPSPASVDSAKVKTISHEKVIEIHNYMHQELVILSQYFDQMKDKDSYDTKSVTIAAQAIVGAKVEQKFDCTSDVIESAVIMHHTTLATDQTFVEVNMKIQQAMGKLMGAELGS